MDKSGDIYNDIGFDECSELSLSNGEWLENFIIFGVDSSFFEDTDNKKKVWLISRWRSNTKIR